MAVEHVTLETGVFEATGYIGAAVAQNIHSFLAPISTGAGFASWDTTPTQIPNPGALITAWVGGALSDDDFTRAVRKYGFSSDPFPGAEIASISWRAVVAASVPQLSIKDAISAYNCGIIGRDWYQFVLTRHGYKEPWYADVFDSLSNRPDLSTVQRYDRLGIDPPRGIGYWYDLSGSAAGKGKELQQFVSLDRHVWTPQECSVLQALGFIDADAVARNLDAGLYVGPGMRSAAIAEGMPRPTWQDAIRLSMLVEPGGQAAPLQLLLAEYPTWTSTMAQWDRRTTRLDSLGSTRDVWGNLTQAQLDWMQHWRPVDSQLAARLMHVAGPHAGNVWLNMGLAPGQWDHARLREALRQEGRLPQDRDALIAASYTSLGIRRIQIMARYGGVGLNDVRRAVYSDGLPPFDAEPMVTALMAHVDEQLHPWTRSVPDRAATELTQRTVDAYAAGLMQFAQAQTQLVAMGLTLERSEAALAAAKDAASLSDGIDSQKRIRSRVISATEERVQAILTRWVSRDLGRQDASNGLTLLGVGFNDGQLLLDAAAEREIALRARQRHDRAERYRVRVADTAASAVEKAYETGAITRGVALQGMVATGLPADAVNAHLDVLDAQAKLAEVKAAISTIKRDYLGGRVTAQEAVLLLARAGVTGPSTQVKLAQWNAVRHTEHKTATAQQVLTWVKRGLMPVNTARSRLLALGWQGLDAQLALADAVASFGNLRARTINATTKSRMAQAKALEQIAAKHQKALTSIQARVKRLVSLSTLKKWYLAGHVSELYVRQRMTAAGYPNDDIELYLMEWQDESIGKGSKLPRKAKGTNGTPPAPAS